MHVDLVRVGAGGTNWVLLQAPLVSHVLPVATSLPWRRLRLAIAFPAPLATSAVQRLPPASSAARDAMRPPLVRPAAKPVRTDGVVYLEPSVQPCAKSVERNVRQVPM